MTEFTKIVYEIIATNSMSWDQSRKLRYTNIDDKHWLENQLPDPNGWIYLFRSRQSRNSTEQLANLRLSEKCGNISAKIDIGDYFYHKSEFTTAMNYYLNAYALSDRIFCPRDIGIMHQHGHDVDVNIKEAIKWFKIAADNGNGLAASDIYENIKELDNVSVSECEKSLEYVLKAVDIYQYNIPNFSKILYQDYIDCKRRLRAFARLQSLDIGSLVYYDVKRYI